MRNAQVSRLGAVPSPLRGEGGAPQLSRIPNGTSGFTLVEVMIAMTIAILIFGLGITLLNATSRARQETQSRLQAAQNARQCFELIERDMANACFVGWKQISAVPLSGAAAQYAVHYCVQSNLVDIPNLCGNVLELTTNTDDPDPTLLVPAGNGAMGLPAANTPALPAPYINVRYFVLRNLLIDPLTNQPYGPPRYRCTLYREKSNLRRSDFPRDYDPARPFRLSQPGAPTLWDNPQNALFSSDVTLSSDGMAFSVTYLWWRPEAKCFWSWGFDDSSGNYYAGNWYVSEIQDATTLRPENDLRQATHLEIKLRFLNPNKALDDNQRWQYFRKRVPIPNPRSYIPGG